MPEKYDDIINLPHHVSSRRSPMPLENRAAQFAPFAALTGHGEAISETARLTSERIVLSDDEASRLSARLSAALAAPSPALVVTYFVPDHLKAGGSYRRYSGVLKKYDEYDRTLVFVDGTVIPIPDIISLD